MAIIMVGTSWISEDDKCLKLWEEDMQSPNYEGFHRYRSFRILRGDKVVEFKEDLGNCSNFRGIEPVVLWCGVIDGGVFYGHNVGEAREMADQYRNHVHFDNKELVGVDNIRLR